MKRVTAFILISVLSIGTFAFVFSGCKASKSDKQDDPSTQSTTVDTITPSEPVTPSATIIPSDTIPPTYPSDTNTYAIDYCGQMDHYTNSRESYPADSEVVLYYNHVATECSYSFYLDDEHIDTEYDSSTGMYIVKFTMPDHDVKLECKSYNSWGAR